MSGFVFEQPESSDRKRRPRAIVSCDYCRAKKSKCLPISGSSRCHACTEASVQCTFQDRDRYQAERDRAYAAYLAESAGATSQQNPFQTYMTSGIVAADLSTTTPLGSQGASMAFFSSTPSPPATSTASTNSSRSGTASPAQNLQPLFANDGTSPHPALMPHFIEAFFRNYDAAFPFLTSECTISSFLRSTLSPVLSNAIAAYAAPICGALPQLKCIDVKQAAAEYLLKSRTLISAFPNDLSISMIEALVLMTHIERGLGKHDVVHGYVQRAMQTAFAAGLSSTEMITAMSRSESERQCLHALWMAVMQLYHETLGP